MNKDLQCNLIVSQFCKNTMQEKFLYAFSGNLFACEQIFNETIATASKQNIFTLPLIILFSPFIIVLLISLDIIV